MSRKKLPGWNFDGFYIAKQVFISAVDSVEAVEEAAKTRRGGGATFSPAHQPGPGPAVMVSRTAPNDPSASRC